MKKAILIALATLTCTTFAAPKKDKDPRPAVKVEKQDGAAVITITGEAAKALYDALEVDAKFQFGLVQEHTKETANVRCQTAILGDIPGRMSGPRYTCTILGAIK